MSAGNTNTEDGVYVVKVTTNDPVIKQLIRGLNGLPGTEVEVNENTGPADQGVNERLGRIRVTVKTEPKDSYPPKTEKEIAAESLPKPDPLLQAYLEDNTSTDLSEELKSIEEKYGNLENKTLLQLVVCPEDMDSDEDALQESIKNGEVIEGDHRNPLSEEEDLGDLDIDEE
ncbi:MAG: hypothetical protein GF334_13325 [Candidatus Altiarchaeales archaeon]|nr:hypothetical protein [Candidatus Altiarchaeales archaeon]